MDMTYLPRRKPEAAYRENGGFSGSLSGRPRSNILMDQIIETTINRFSKSTGGIGGKTEHPGACEKWTRLNYYLCALKKKHMDKKVRTIKHVQHVEFGRIRMEKDKADDESIVILGFQICILILNR